MTTENPYQPPAENEPVVDALYSCPKCGESCDQGVVHALGNITWIPKMSSFRMVRPERLSPKALNLESKLDAFRCQACDHVIICLAQIREPKS